MRKFTDDDFTFVCKSIIDLILNNNTRYRATVTAWVGSSLKLLDNKILGKDMSTKALADVEGLALLVNATDTILDDAEGSERCVYVFKFPKPFLSCHISLVLLCVVTHYF